MSEKHQCEGRVRYGDWGRSKQCLKTGAYEHEGKHYCKTHHPPTAKEKDEKRKAQWHAKWDAERAARVQIAAEAAEQKRRADCFPDLLEALQMTENALYNGATPDLSMIRAAIAKATG